MRACVAASLAISRVHPLGQLRVPLEDRGVGPGRRPQLRGRRPDREVVDRVAQPLRRLPRADHGPGGQVVVPVALDGDPAPRVRQREVRLGEVPDGHVGRLALPCDGVVRQALGVGSPGLRPLVLRHRRRRRLPGVPREDVVDDDPQRLRIGHRRLVREEGGVARCRQVLPQVQQRVEHDGATAGALAHARAGVLAQHPLAQPRHEQRQHDREGQADRGDLARAAEGDARPALRVGARQHPPPGLHPVDGVDADEHQEAQRGQQEVGPGQTVGQDGGRHAVDGEQRQAGDGRSAQGHREDVHEQGDQSQTARGHEDDARGVVDRRGRPVHHAQTEVEEPAALRRSRRARGAGRRTPAVAGRSPS